MRAWWAVMAAAALLTGCSDPFVHLLDRRAPTFDRGDMRDLRFLAGDWTGQGPDGVPFFERYVFRDALTLSTRRYKDASFAEQIDGSTVILEGQQIVSRWGRYSWKAVRVRRGHAEFAPIDAPGSFTWRRVDRDHVEVTQRWTDAKGPQSYALTLRRLR